MRIFDRRYPQLLPLVYGDNRKEHSIIERGKVAHTKKPTKSSLGKLLTIKKTNKIRMTNENCRIE